MKQVTVTFIFSDGDYKKIREVYSLQELRAILEEGGIDELISLLENLEVYDKN